MKKRNRILPVIMAVLMFLNSFYCPMPSVSAAGGMTLQELQQKFPAGKYWNHVGSNINNPDGYTNTPCNHHGNCDYYGSCGCNSAGNSIQCFGFANKCAYDVYGSYYTSWNKTSLSNVKAGDVIRYKNNGHSIFVTAVNGNIITYGDCNSDGHCIIRWNQTISKSTVAQTLTNVYSAPYELPMVSAIDPIGDINACTGEDGKLHIRGWAFDKSDVNQTLLIHVYIGNEAHVIAANHSRPDVDDNYPGVGDNHGFDYYIQTNQVGLQWIQIWAINIGTGNNVQLWGNAVHIKPEGTDAISNGTYVISSSLDDNAVFDISEASMRDGGNLMICQYNGGDNQKFEVTYLGNNRYKMIAKHSGKSLDVQDANTSSGANVQQCTPNGGTNQQWMLQDAGDGYYYIFSSMNGLCIDLADGSTANNNNIRMFDFNGSAAQKWKLSPVLDKVIMNELENTSTGVKISWNALENAKSYQIARRTPGTEWSVLKKGVTGTSYIDETAKEGVTYYYTVYGLNGNFGSSVSDETKSITCYRVPEDVSLTSLVNTAVGVRLQWNEVENADVYRIYRRTANGSWQLLSRTITGTTCIDKTAKTGEKYYYAVRAQNGNSVSQGYDTKKSITCIREMGKVKINSLTDVGSGVNVKWDYLYGADTYRVYRKEAGGQWICLKTGIKRNTFTDTTAKKQNIYYYTVKPENGEVVGMEYDDSKSIAYGKTIGKVTLTSMENIKEGVHLSWNTVSGAETYRVIRRISGSEWEVIASGIKRPVYTDTTAKPEQKYFYAVLAENGDNLSGEFDSKRWIIYRR